MQQTRPNIFQQSLTFKLCCHLRFLQFRYQKYVDMVNYHHVIGMTKSALNEQSFYSNWSEAHFEQILVERKRKRQILSGCDCSALRKYCNLKKTAIILWLQSLNGLRICIRFRNSVPFWEVKDIRPSELKSDGTILPDIRVQIKSCFPDGMEVY